MLGVMKTRDRLGLAVAWGVVPVTFAVFIFASYRYALSRGRLPFGESTEWMWWAAFGFGIILGALAIFSTGAGETRVVWRTFFALCYVVIMGAFLFGIGLYIACLQGDCI